MGGFLTRGALYALYACRVGSHATGYGGVHALSEGSYDKELYSLCIFERSGVLPAISIIA